MSPPDALIDSMARSLAAVSRLGHPARDSALVRFGITPRLGWDPYTSYIEADSTAPWSRRWREGRVETGVAGIDSVLADLGATIEPAGPPHTGATYKLRTRRPVNWWVLGERLDRIPGIGRVRPEWFLGVRSGVNLERTSGGLRLQYFVGWGDCAAGCIHGHWWTFETDGVGEARFVACGGDPLPDSGVGEGVGVAVGRQAPIQESQREVLDGLPAIDFGAQCSGGDCDHDAEARVFGVLDSLGNAVLEPGLSIGRVRRLLGDPPDRNWAPGPYERCGVGRGLSPPGGRGTELRRVSFGSGVGAGHDVAGAGRDRDPELGQVTPDGVFPRGPGLEASLPDAVAEGLELAPPVMGRAAGFHDHLGRLPFSEEAPVPGAAEAVTLVHPPGLVRDRDLEDRLCPIHPDLRSVHVGSPFT